MSNQTVRIMDTIAREPETAVMQIAFGVSDTQIEQRHGMSRTDTVRAIAESVASARRQTGEVEFSAEDATRAEPQFLRQCVWAAVEAGATRVSIADMAGGVTPKEIDELVRDVAAFVEGKAAVSARRDTNPVFVAMRDRPPARIAGRMVHGPAMRAACLSV